ncbi:putative transcription factor interactor and regulator CCHC(Zn) family [Helianthus anomalus]
MIFHMLIFFLSLKSSHLRFLPYMPEISSQCGLIPPTIPPLPPDKPPDDSFQPSAKNSVDLEPIEAVFAQPPTPSGEKYLGTRPPYPPEIVNPTLIASDSSPISSPSNIDVQVDGPIATASHEGTVFSSQKQYRNKRNSSSSGDKDLDRIRAESVAHDHALMREAGLPPGGFKSANPKKGVVKIKGFKNSKHVKHVVKYGPALSDLRIKGFVEETQRIVSKSKKGPVKWAAIIEAETSLQGKSTHNSVIDEQELGNVTAPTQMEEDNLYDMQQTTASHNQVLHNQYTTQNLQPIGLSSVNTVNGDTHKDHKADDVVNQATSTTDDGGALNSEMQNGEVTNRVSNNVWFKQDDKGLSFAERIRINNAAGKVRLEYIPPVITPEGKCRVVLSNDDLMHSAKVYPLYLYGYFLGTSMDFNVVNRTLRRLWHAYDIAEITKSSAGYYYFKFFSEKGLNEVLENGPWLINNIPIFINKWVPGLCLEKVEPKTIHIWVTVHSFPLELWTDLSLSKIFSGIGRPLLLDKITHTRVTQHTGKLGYARMLVEAQASTNLPNEVEVEFPADQHRKARVGVLQVSYQWKPTVCSYCEVFGHSLNACNSRPRTEPDCQNAPANSTPPTKPPSDKSSKDMDMDVNDTEFAQVTRKPKQKSNVPNGKSVSNNQQGNSSGVKKGGSGFNFGRAIQGLSSQKMAVKQPHKPQAGDGKKVQNSTVNQAQYGVKQPQYGAATQVHIAQPGSKKVDVNLSPSAG